jgi:hypothetical protein
MGCRRKSESARRVGRTGIESDSRIRTRFVVLYKAAQSPARHEGRRVVGMNEIGQYGTAAQNVGSMD